VVLCETFWWKLLRWWFSGFRYSGLQEPLRCGARGVRRCIPRRAHAGVGSQSSSLALVSGSIALPNVSLHDERVVRMYEDTYSAILDPFLVDLCWWLLDVGHGLGGGEASAASMTARSGAWLPFNRLTGRGIQLVGCWCGHAASCVDSRRCCVSCWFSSFQGQ